MLAGLLVSMARFFQPLSTVILYTAILEMIGSALEQRQPPAVPVSRDIGFDAVTFQYVRAVAPTIGDFTATPCLPAV